MAEALLCAASKYQILALTAACEAFLLHHLTVDNAIVLLRLADLLSLVKMKETILVFVSQHGPEIAQTKEYNMLEGELQREVISHPWTKIASQINIPTTLNPQPSALDLYFIDCLQCTLTIPPIPHQQLVNVLYPHLGAGVAGCCS